MKDWLLWILIVSIPSGLQAQIRYTIVIDEIMVDPSPSVALPNNEWIELKNTTSLPVNLLNWRIGDATGQSGPLPGFILQPDSFIIVCSGTAVTALSAFATTISVTSFPSLDNEGDQLFLRSSNGTTIHAVNYSSAWYRNEVKRDGGWSLEMIDTKNPCAGPSNWKASMDLNGGTPGKKNTIDGVNNDQTIPLLARAYTTDTATIVLVFDEPVDSLSGATLTNYSVDGGLLLTSAVTLPPLFNQVQLKTNSSLAANTIYTIMASHIKDCSNNTIGTVNKVKTGLPVDPAAGEWIINEILFNPRPSGFDYIEFYNNSTKLFDASKLYVANRNNAGTISSIQLLSTVPFYVFPNDHMVITQDADNLGVNYLVSNADHVFVMASPPSFPDDEGTVVALNFQGLVVDEVKYKVEWHFQLLDNVEGVALERVDPAASSLEPGNWHSASSTAGYGTPTYKNSQYKQQGSIKATIEVHPKIFSPDNDGRDDIATIQYKVNEPGYVANIIVFDGAGRVVRNLVRNAMLGITGYWNWDGLNDKNLMLPVGTYIIYTELFNLQGKKERFRNVIVLARKLN